MKKITLKMISPLMLGGSKATENHLRSLPYIPGDRIRAAIAKDIVLQCKMGNIESYDNKINWIFIKDTEECKGCKFYETCRSFSDIKISFFYPEGTDILPFTAMKYKYHENGFFDCLIREPDASLLLEGERLETVYGFRKGTEIFEEEYIYSTKTAINWYTRTSRENMLYTMEALKDNYSFVGYIEGFEKLNLKVQDILRVGADISTGYGCMVIEKIEDDDRTSNLNSDFTLFNDRYMNDKHHGKKILSMTFKSNAKLGLENHNLNKEKDLKKAWKGILEKAGLKGFEYEVLHVYTESQIYRGFDTSSKIPMRKAIILTLMGTAILLEVEEAFDLALLEGIEEDGLGSDTMNGFGQVKFLDKFHLEGGAFCGKERNH